MAMVALENDPGCHADDGKTSHSRHRHARDPPPLLPPRRGVPSRRRMGCSDDLSRQSLLPRRASAFERCDPLSLLVGHLLVQLGESCDRFPQERAAMIATAGVFNVDKGFFGGGQANGYF